MFKKMRSVIQSDGSPQTKGGSSSESATADKQNNASNSHYDTDAQSESTPVHSRKSSISSMTSDTSSFMHQSKSITSDLESEAGTSVNAVEVISKPELYKKFTQVQTIARKYKVRCKDMLDEVETVKLENQKLKSTLTTFQDKTLQRMSEFREQSKLEQQAKQDLRDFYESEILEKDECIKVLELQVKLLKEGQDLPDEIKHKISLGHEREASKKKEMESQMNSFKEKIDSAEKQIAKSKELLDNQKSKNEDLVTEKDSLIKKVEVFKVDQDKYRKKVDDLNQKLNAVKIEFVAKMESLKQQSSASLVGKDKEIAALKSKLTQSKEEDGRMKDEQCQSELNELRQNYESKMTSLKSDLEKLRLALKEKEEEFALAIEERDMQKSAAISACSEEMKLLKVDLSNLLREKDDCDNALLMEKEQSQQWQKKFEEYKLKTDQLLSDDRLKLSQELDCKMELFESQKKKLDETFRSKFESEKASLEDMFNERCQLEKKQVQEELESEFATTKSSLQAQFSEVLKDKEEQIEILQDSNNGLQKQVRSYCENVDQMSKQLEDKKNELAELEKNQIAIIEGHTNAIDKYDQRIRELNDELKELQSLCDSKDKMICDLNGKLSSSGNSIQDMSARISELEKNVVELATHKESLQRNLDAFSLECEKLRNELDEKGSVEEKLIELKKQESECQYNLEKLKDDYDLVCGELEQFKEANDKLSVEVSHKVEQLQKLQSKNDVVVEDNKKLGDSLNKAYTEVRQLQSECKEYSSELKGCFSLIEESKIVNFKKVSDSSACSLIGSLIENYKNCLAEKSKLSCTLEESEIECSDLKIEVEHLRTKLQQLNKANTELHSQLKEAIDSYGADCDERIKDLLQKVHDYESNVSNLEENLSQCQDDVSAKEREIAALKVRIQSLIKDSEDNDQESCNKVQQLLDDLEKEKNEVLHLQMSLHEKEEEISYGSEQLEKLTSCKDEEVFTTEQKVKECVSELEKQSLLIMEKNGEIESLKADLAKVVDEMRTLEELKDEDAERQSSLMDEVHIYKDQLLQSQNHCKELKESIMQLTEHNGKLTSALHEFELAVQAKEETHVLEMSKASKEFEILQQKTGEIDSLNDDLKTLSEEYQSSQTLCEQLQESVKLKEDEMLQLISEIESLKNQLNELRDNNKISYDQLQKKIEDCKSLSEELETAKLYVQNKNHDIQQLNSNLEVLQNDYKQLQESSDVTCNELKQQIEHLQKIVDNKSSHLSSLEEQLQQMNSGKDETLSKLNINLLDLQKEKSTLETRCAELETDVTRNAEQLSILKQQNVNLEQNVAEITDTNESTNKSLEKAYNDMKISEDKYRELEQKMVEVSSSESAKFSELSVKLRESESIIENIRSKNDDLDFKCEEYHKIISDLESKLSELSESQRTLLSELNDSKSMCDEMERKLSDNDKVVEDLKNSLLELKSHSSDKDLQLNEAKNELEIMKKEHGATKEQIEKLSHSDQMFLQRVIDFLKFFSSCKLSTSCDNVSTKSIEELSESLFPFLQCVLQEASKIKEKLDFVNDSYEKDIANLKSEVDQKLKDQKTELGNKYKALFQKRLQERDEKQSDELLECQKNVDSLKNELLEMKSSKLIVEERCKTLSTELEDSQNKVSNSQKNFTDFTKAVCVLLATEFMSLERDKLQIILKHLKQCETQRKQLSESVRSLQSSTEQKTTEEKQLLDNLKANFEKIVNQTHGNIQSNMQTIFKKLGAVDKKVASVNALALSASDKVNLVCGTRNSLNETVTSLQKSLNDKTEELKNLQQDLSHSKDRYENDQLIVNEEHSLQLSSLKREAKVQIDQQKQEVKKCKVEYDNLKKKYEERLVEKENEIQGLSEKFENLQKQLVGKESEIQQSASHSDSQIDNLKELLNNSKIAEENAKTENLTLSKDKQNLQVKVGKLNDQILQLQKSISEMDSNKDQAASSAQKLFQDKLQEVQTENSAKIKSLQTDFNSKMQEKEKEFHERYSETVNRLQKAELSVKQDNNRKIDDLQRKLEVKDSEIDELEQRLLSFNSEKLQLSEKIKLLENDCEDVRKKLYLAETDGASLKTANEELIIEVENLKRQLEEQDAKVKKNEESSQSSVVINDNGGMLDGSRNVKLEDYEALQMHCDDLQNQVNVLSQELQQATVQSTTSNGRPLSETAAISRLSSVSSSAEHLWPYQYHNLGEIPEIEYLKNVLYEYMLGRETMTLAKVICTVLKFSNSQIQNILEHEQKKSSSWLPTA